MPRLPNGSHGLVKRPGDMSKIGFLYLKGGYWENRLVIPEKWVEESTQHHAEITWKGIIADSYGFGWYIQSSGFHCLGDTRATNFVLPGAEIVAVITSELALHKIELAHPLGSRTISCRPL